MLIAGNAGTDKTIPPERPHNPAAMRGDRREDAAGLTVSKMRGSMRNKEIMAYGATSHGIMTGSPHQNPSSAALGRLLPQKENTTLAIIDRIPITRSRDRHDSGS
jgi:hypothetical protein